MRKSLNNFCAIGKSNIMLTLTFVTVQKEYLRNTHKLFYYKHIIEIPISKGANLQT